MDLSRSNRGQTLILFAFAIVGLVALAALLIDGGSIYLNRRHAQTAADAAAMAAAYTKCVEHPGMSDEEVLPYVQATAYEYAVTENHTTASMESAEIDENGQVVVNTGLETPSFFASILGQQNDAARAQAAAGCFIPKTTKNLLPIAWTCQPPLDQAWEDTCDTHTIPAPVFRTLRQQLGDSWFGTGTNLLDEPAVPDDQNPDNYHDGVGGKMVYMVVDDDNFDYSVCLPPIGSGTIVCDFNGDGSPDIMAGLGQRGWLSLTGVPGAAELIDLLLGGYSGAVTLPQWFQGQTGTINSVYIAADQILFNLSLVPVFNAVCGVYPTDPACSDPVSGAPLYQTGDLISPMQGNGTWYRVPGFAQFVVTCVSKGNPQPCPAKTYSGVDPNTSTMEGYFLSGVVAGSEIDPNGFDLGVYIISLTR